MLTKEVVARAIASHDDIQQAAIDYATGDNHWTPVNKLLEKDIDELSKNDLYTVWNYVSARLVTWCDYNDPDAPYKSQFARYANYPQMYRPPFHLLVGE